MLLAGAPAPVLPQRPRAVIIVIDRVALSELQGPETPHLAGLLAESGVGLVSTAGPDRNPASVYASIAAGRRIALGTHSGRAMAVTELCGDTAAGLLYQRRSGWEAGQAAIVIPGWPEVLAAAAVTAPGSQPGQLGERVRALGLATALVGASDRPGEPHRWAGLLVADSKGRIDHGELGPHLVSHQAGAPFGVMTAWTELLAATETALDHAALVVVDTGQTLRADDYAVFCTPTQASELKQEALVATDRFVGAVVQLLDPERDLLLVLSPGAPGGNNAAMSPVIITGPGFGAGLVASPATRWPGVIAPTDIAPLILAHLSGEAGRAPGVAPSTDAPATVAGLVGSIALSEERRYPLLRGYVLIQMALVAGVLATVWLKLRLAHILRPLLLAVAVTPLVLLLLGAWPAGLVTSALVTILLTVAASLLLYRWNLRRHPATAFLVVSLATVVALTLDVVSGYNLIRFSPLGYSPVSAFRFYGIGNELLGVYLGAALVGLGALADHLVRTGREHIVVPLLLLGFTATVAVLASPTLGANLGGTVAAATAMTWTAATIRGLRQPLRQAALALGTAAIVAMLVFGLDTFMRPPSLQSHFGQAGAETLENGVRGLVTTIERKITLNLRLIRFTIWSRVFLSSLAGFLLLLYRPPGLVRQILSQNPGLARSMGGVLIGAVVALLVNDSGVVAAATTVIHATAVLGYLALEPGYAELT